MLAGSVLVKECSSIGRAPVSKTGGCGFDSCRSCHAIRSQKREKIVKPIAVSQFLTQVKQEASKVTWSSRKEVIATTIMILIVVLLVGLFFFGVDAVLFRVVEAILGF